MCLTETFMLSSMMFFSDEERLQKTDTVEYRSVRYHRGVNIAHRFHPMMTTNAGTNGTYGSCMQLLR